MDSPTVEPFTCILDNGEFWLGWKANQDKLRKNWKMLNKRVWYIHGRDLNELLSLSKSN